MRKLGTLLSLFVLLTAFMCENEPIDGELVGDTNNPNASTSVLGEWQLVRFNATVETSGEFNGIDMSYTSTIESTTVDYQLTFAENTYTTVGDYSYTSTVSIAGQQTITSSDTVNNLSGGGTYSTNGNEMTISGAFYEFEYEGVDLSEYLEGEQTATFELSDNGQTLTFTSNETQTNSDAGFEVTSTTVGISVWTRSGGGNTGGETDAVGTWLLTEWNAVDEPVDINNDGILNTNLLDEMDCYNNETVEFNAGGTGVSTNNSYADIFIEILIENGVETTTVVVDCIEEFDTTNFTWTQTGSTITVTESGESFDYTISDNTISVLIPEGLLIYEADGITVNTIQDMIFVFTKQ